VADEPESRDEMASEQAQNEPLPGELTSEAAAPEDPTPLEGSDVIDEQVAAESAAGAHRKMIARRKRTRKRKRKASSSGTSSRCR